MLLRKTLRSAVLIISLATVFSNCKKGDDDPVLSLRTRKARVVGDWHIESGSVSFTYYKKSGSTFNQRITFSNTNATMTETYQGGIPTIYTGSYLLNMSFKKDGKFEMSETFAGYIVKASGRWNFVNGVGELKNKESINIVLDATTSGDTQNGLFNKFNTEFSYRIKELRNKKMVIETSNQLYVSADGNKTTFAGNYALIQ